MRRRTVGRFKSALGFITRLLVTWKFYVRPTGSRRSRAVGERQGSLSLRVSAEARASPTPHVYVEHLRSRRPGPACRRFVQALAALKRLVNGYSVSPAKLIMDDDDDQSVDMDELVFRPNPERLGLELSHSDDEE